MVQKQTQLFRDKKRGNPFWIPLNLTQLNLHVEESMSCL